jgi:hypothetical protein
MLHHFRVSGTMFMSCNPAASALKSLPWPVAKRSRQNCRTERKCENSSCFEYRRYIAAKSEQKSSIFMLSAEGRGYQLPGNSAVFASAAYFARTVLGLVKKGNVSSKVGRQGSVSLLLASAMPPFLVSATIPLIIEFEPSFFSGGDDRLFGKLTEVR